MGKTRKHQELEKELLASFNFLSSSRSGVMGERNQSRLPIWSSDGQNMIEAAGLGLEDLQPYYGEEEDLYKME
ncbi:hypothetical protein QYF36_011390 [Acer negundo]|nr:hypothetical protein QYF36_011390 [Acer negundo]